MNTKIINKNKDDLLNILLNMFPENELDAFHWIMYYLATTLDKKPKIPIIFIITGKESNGKLTFLELIKSAFDYYNYGVNINILFLTNTNRNREYLTNLNKLKTTRLAYYTNIEQNKTLNLSIIKELTLIEKVSTRKHNFNCSHILITNYQYNIKRCDDNTWKKIFTYRFKYKYCDNPENEFEKKAIPNLLKNKRIEFLSILSKYLTDLRNNYEDDINNVPKPTIDAETLEYQNSQII